METGIIKIENDTKWIVCPHCGKKNIRVTDKTKIKMLLWKCKGSGCRKEFLINT